ncbi:MAG: hypothetical protein ACYC9O_06520 [Candidatus Latescibacterota bacterium]
MQKKVCAALLIFLAACGSHRPADKSMPIREGWTFSQPRYGSDSGRTRIEVVFPKAGRMLPVSFGIPLGQARSADEITLLDEQGKEIPASFFPLGNWESQPARWALVSAALDAERDGLRRMLTLRWGKRNARKAAGAVTHSIDDSRVTVENGVFTLMLSPRGIERINSKGDPFPAFSGRPVFVPLGGKPFAPRNGSLTVLYNGQTYKRYRFTSFLADSLELHQEYEIFAGSPYVRCAARFINRSLHDMPLDGVTPLEVPLSGGERLTVGVGEDPPASASRFSIRQGAFACSGECDGVSRAIPESKNGAVWAGVFGESGSGVLFVFPRFRDMAAGEPGLESVVSGGDGALRFTHYRRIAPDADVRLRETIARTFTWTLAVGIPQEQFTAAAEAVISPPSVACDRAYLTGMGVFPEESVSHLFDPETDEGARYFLQARVPRAEYSRCGRGTEPGYDGEGLYEVNLHAGGMVAGEVFQYFSPRPDRWLLDHYGKTLKIAPEHLLTGGKFSYRNGDIPLALFQQYLRTGDPEFGGFAREHALLYADYAVSHAHASQGLGHYYCDWYANPYVYQRFSGLLLGWLVTGDPWLFETARAMADWSLRAWKDGTPRDGLMNGALGGVQSRSAYIAGMHLTLFDLTGDRACLENAIRLAEWAARTQERDGWWVMDPTNTDSRAYRCTPIFAGYICQGLWPLFHRTGNPDLKASLLRAADWYLRMSEDARGSNPGTFPNSYWYGASGSEAKPVPISGNYATTQHAASALLEAYRATGKGEYFYGANAAWAGVLNHQTSEGGIPLENTAENSVWSHVLIESLPRFAATAERDRLPVLLSSKTGVPGTSFLGKGASWDGKTFRFELKYKSASPVPLRVYFPAGKPKKVLLNGKAIPEIAYDEKTKVARFSAPESAKLTVCGVTVKR